MAGDKKIKQTPEYEFNLPPPKLTKWEAFSQFMWNGETNEFMGRTASSWGKIGIFYLFFYAALAAFFAIMLVIFYQTLDPNQPKWKLDSSLIGSNPGLGFRPMPGPDNVDSTLIWFKKGTQTDSNWQPWVSRLSSFLADYDPERQYGHNMMDCDWGRRPENNEVCKVDISKIAINNTKNYGYETGQPSIVLKLNKIVDWVPVPYVGDNVPEDMPETLKNKVRKFNPNHTHIWVSCEGEHPADKENIGPLTYSPEQGFPTYFYPFTNTPGYLSPIVMIQFVKPPKGILLNIECRAWAQNIHYNRMERKGAVHFELLMD